MATIILPDEPAYGRGIRYIGDVDPGAVGAWEVWVELPAVGPAVSHMRNAADTAWLDVGSGGSVPFAIGGVNDAPGQAVTEATVALTADAFDSVPLALSPDVTYNGDGTFTVNRAGWYDFRLGASCLNVALAGGGVDFVGQLVLAFLDGATQVAAGDRRSLIGVSGFNEDIQWTIAALVRLPAAFVIDTTTLHLDLTPDAGTMTGQVSAGLLTLQWVADY